MVGTGFLYGSIDLRNQVPSNGIDRLTIRGVGPIVREEHEYEQAIRWVEAERSPPSWAVLLENPGGNGWITNAQLALSIEEMLEMLLSQT